MVHHGVSRDDDFPRSPENGRINAESTTVETENIFSTGKTHKCTFNNLLHGNHAINLIRWGGMSHLFTH